MALLGLLLLSPTIGASATAALLTYSPPFAAPDATAYTSSSGAGGLCTNGCGGNVSVTTGPSFSLTTGRADTSARANLTSHAGGRGGAGYTATMGLVLANVTPGVRGRITINATWHLYGWLNVSAYVSAGKHAILARAQLREFVSIYQPSGSRLWGTLSAWSYPIAVQVKDATRSLHLDGKTSSLSVVAQGAQPKGVYVIEAFLQVEVFVEMTPAIQSGATASASFAGISGPVLSQIVVTKG